MMTREIRPETWPTYWQNLSRLYQGWWVTIEELGHELGDQRLADRLPLQGISFDSAGSEAGAILIDSSDPKIAGMDAAALSFVRLLYQIAE